MGNPTPGHAGSWFGLPDFGLTEAIQSVIAPQKAYASSGGSNLIGPSTPVPTQGVQGTQTTNFLGGGSPSSLNVVPTGGGSGGSGGSPTGGTPTGGSPTGGTPTGGSTPGVDNAAIDQAYSGELNFLNSLQPQLQSNYDTGVSAANQQYTGQQKTIADQLGSLNTQLGIDTNKWNQNMGSAYSQAQNAYNQLLQRNLALYGTGTGAGPALAAILGQGYQQQSGELTNQNLNGQQQLQLQGQNINQWGDTQNNQLDTWHNQALQTLQTTFQNGINAINQQKGQTEDAKSQAKLGLLQNLINQQNALNSYKDQLSAYMQAYQSATPSQMGVTQFNPGNYAATMSNLGGQVGQTQGKLSSAFGVVPQTASTIAASGGFFPTLGNTQQNQNDPLQALLNQGQQTA